MVVKKICKIKTNLSEFANLSFKFVPRLFNCILPLFVLQYSSFWNHKAKSYGIKTTSYGIKTTSYGIKTTSYGMKTTSYGMKTSSYAHKTTSYAHKTGLG